MDQHPIYPIRPVQHRYVNKVDMVSMMDHFLSRDIKDYNCLQSQKLPMAMNKLRENLFLKYVVVDLIH